MLPAKHGRTVCDVSICRPGIVRIEAGPEVVVAVDRIGTTTSIDLKTSSMGMVWISQR